MTILYIKQLLLPTVEKKVILLPITKRPLLLLFAVSPVYKAFNIYKPPLLLFETCYSPTTMTINKKKILNIEVWILLVGSTIVYVNAYKPHPSLFLFIVKKYNVNTIIFNQKWVKKRCSNILSYISNKISFPLLVNLIQKKPVYMKTVYPNPLYFNKYNKFNYKHLLEFLNFPIIDNNTHLSMTYNIINLKYIYYFINNDLVYLFHHIYKEMYIIIMKLIYNILENIYINNNLITQLINTICIINSFSHIIKRLQVFKEKHPSYGVIQIPANKIITLQYTIRFKCKKPYILDQLIIDCRENTVDLIKQYMNELLSEVMTQHDDWFKNNRISVGMVVTIKTSDSEEETISTTISRHAYNYDKSFKRNVLNDIEKFLKNYHITHIEEIFFNRYKSMVKEVQPN